MPQAPFPVDPTQTAITIGYRNESYIADEVLPRVPVDGETFKYKEYPVEEGFTMPDTKVGRKGAPNEIDLTATEKEASTEDHGLDDPVPQKDIDNAPKGHNPVDRATMQLTDYIALGREIRSANVVFNEAKYPSSCKIQLSGNSQFSDYANSDPLGVIMEGLDACLIRPNIMVLGQAVYTKLARHPKIVKSVHGNDGDSGIASRKALAQLFELEDVFVGKSRLNTARKGQNVNLSRVWGNHISLIHRNKLADTRSGLTFGFTAQWGNRIAGAIPDPKIGMRGGLRVRVGESVKEVISAGFAGYFIEDAV